VSDSQAVTVNAGAYLALRCRGGCVIHCDTAGLSETAYLAARVDEGPWRPLRLEPGDERVEIPADGIGAIEVVATDINEHANRWRPPFASALRIVDVDAELLDPPELPDSLIEFYGDSITQGIRANPKCDSPDGSDAIAGYAFVTARALRMRHHQVGFGRQGILRPGNGEVPPAPETFGWNFAGSPAAAMDPDVVVVNQGTNDLDDPGFESAYGAYLRQIRGAYPAAWIFALRPFGGYHADEIARAAKELGDPRIVPVDTTGWLGPDDFTDGVHPNVRGHRVVADQLAPLIRSRIR
jgi:lysophospholipase L1-like esterase